MIATEQWVVTVYIDERDDRTRAEARLMKRGEPELRGNGIAHRNPRDVNVPEIGAELAASRALSQLADQLLDVSAADVERSTGQPAHFHS
ncbi:MULTISPECIES: DUF1876 domain-containing protein [Actinopolyspora]|uniref:DUF1876 domain-containing protein n=1 Tax=Actinopolyspora saharensis TaxID=995062 RepID=A0A1H1A4I7_9ACTN|nr:MULTISPECIES: DUF1876 domain-containing protein [Actinopolyspora]NHD16842.1 DUF1876 domain-containing protein [Actinopolyspora sp. BKK2]NHE75994.1 DUF1876 domain-containing protein [Actinopolyspora sp. BKK1]SDQ34554.1 protein of unknown function [Actinopolyspora saharensis]